MAFSTDPRLLADTHLLAQWPLCELRLMDDAHYPWLILVPRIEAARELVDIPAPLRPRLWQEIDAAAALLQEVFTPHKLNIAALGNVVAQLHVHVIARFTHDAAWPRPVWGVLPNKPYDAEALAQMQRRLTASARFSPSEVAP